MNKSKSILGLSLALIVFAVTAIATTSSTSTIMQFEINGGQATLTSYSGNDKKVSIPETFQNTPVTGISSTAFSSADRSVIEQISMPVTMENIEKDTFADFEEFLLVFLELSDPLADVPSDVDNWGLGEYTAQIRHLTATDVTQLVLQKGEMPDVPVVPEEETPDEPDEPEEQANPVYLMAGSLYNNLVYAGMDDGTSFETVTYLKEGVDVNVGAKSAMSRTSSIPPSNSVNVSLDGEYDIMMWTEDTDIFVWFDGDYIVMPEDLSNYFYNTSFSTTTKFTNLTEVNGLEYWETSNVKNMYRMFYGCTVLETADVSNFDTSNTTNLSYMFWGCSKLSEIDVSNFDTSSVTTLQYMFYNCSSATELDVSNFNTENVTAINYMFYGCSSVKSLDLGNFDTSKLTSIASLFNGCTSLEKVDMQYFYMTSVNGFNAGSVFTNCDKLTEIYVNSETEANFIKSVPTYNTNFELIMTIAPEPPEPDETPEDDNTETPTGTAYAYDDGLYTTIKNNSMSSVKYTKVEFTNTKKPSSDVTTIDMSKSGDNSVLLWADGTELYIWFDGATLVMPESMASYFDSWTSWSSTLYNLAEIDGLHLLDTSNVKNMSKTFANAQYLTSIDVSGFDTTNVEYFNSMFYGCYGLKSVDVSGFKTSNATTFASMFGSCKALETVDISGFDTSNATTFNAMFLQCNALKNIDISKFNTSKATDMANMFGYCYILESLDLSSFNTQNVTSMSYMFAGCRALTSLDFSSFNTQNVTTMASMFQSCVGMTSIDLSAFNTTNVTTMANMFSGCTYLDLVNVSNFNTEKTTSLNSMFKECTNLTVLDLSSFEIRAVKDEENFPDELTMNIAYIFQDSGLITVYARDGRDQYILQVSSNIPSYTNVEIKYT